MALTVVVEPNPGGHRFQAARNVLRRAGRRGDVLLVTSRGATGGAEYATFLAADAHAVVEAFDGPLPPTPELVAVLRRIVAERPVTTVVVMEGDDHLRTWFLRGRLGRRVRVVFFLTRYPARLDRHSGAASWRLRLAKGLLVLAARVTGTLHRAAGFAARDDLRRGLLVARARDPVECSAHARDRAALRTMLGLPHDRVLVGISGGINARKDPPLVLDAVLASGLDADLVLSGPFSDEARAWLERLPPEHRARVVADDGFLDDDRLDASIAAVDVVVLAMTLEGPSGIQGKALAAGVPIVTAGSRTRARELAATGGGAAAEHSVEGIAAALRDVVASGTRPDTGAFALPTGETFAATVLGD